MFVAPLESISRGANIFRELNTLAIAETEELIKRQRDLAETLLASTSREVTKAYESVGAVKTPQDWSEAMKTNLRTLVEITRDCMAATADYNAANLVRMQKQAIEVQKLFAGSLNESNAGGSPSREKHTSRAR
jgi:hypothetical protein